MRITFVKTENNELKKILELLEKDIRAFNLTKFHRGSLRNGQKIEFDGSVVVVGDVNPGAEIKATGNIIILGQLKGMAHAGCKGMTDAFVTAVYMAPVQLRIADIITRFPGRKQTRPEAARIRFRQRRSDFRHGFVVIWENKLLFAKKFSCKFRIYLLKYRYI